MTVPRDPEHYSPSTHSKQQRRWRNIEWRQVAEAIQEGNVKNATGKDTYLFVHDKREYDDPLGVVVDSADGQIVTVEWRHD